MNLKRKYFIMILLMLISVCVFAGCNSISNPNANLSENNNTQPKKIICTIFPAYDWVKEITKGLETSYDIVLLQDNNIDNHNYQPTVEDIAEISTCDMFIYVGGESDDWVEDILAEAINKDITAINLLELMGDAVKMEEIVEGMEVEDEENKSHEEDTELVESECDEHVWLSLKNAQILVNAITESLRALDLQNTDTLQTNTNSYLEQLEKLDEEYSSVVTVGTQKTILFGDRFPFRYLTDDYGLDYYAAFAGCSAETEASFETIVFLAEKVEELELSCIITIENSSPKIAETIIQNTQSKNQSILSLNSMQSITVKDIENGKTYYSIMKENLETLKIALQ